MTDTTPDPLMHIRDAAEAHFGAPVLRIETPGGSARASCRVVFEDRTVIATHRVNFRRTHLEAMVLKDLSDRCDAVPKFLGLREDTLFQGDVGRHRLNVVVAKADPIAAEDLADQAVGAIFAYQIAAQDLSDRLPLPPLGGSETWVDGLVSAVDVLRPMGPGLPRSFDRNILAEILMTKPRRFVKWDCRSGNAALDDAGTLRWFDFEYCGLRHGSEDFAWLIADEVWPVPPATMIEVLRDNYRDHFDEGFDDWLSYLSFYTVFHALQRLRLIVDEVKARGWKSKARIRDRDDVGIHPEFAAALCATGAFFADRDRRTAGLVPAFEAAQSRFLRLLEKKQVA